MTFSGAAASAETNRVHVLGRRARITRGERSRVETREPHLGRRGLLEPCLNTDATFLPSDEEEDEEDEQMKARP